MAGLLDFLGNMGATPPSYMEGLLGADQMEKLKGQATSTGLANMVLGYLAAPKNQNLGLGRILGGALQSGMQGAQGVYSGALGDYETQQKINLAQKAKEKQAQLESMISNIQDPNEKLYAQLAPDQWVAAKVKPKAKQYEKVGDQLVDVSGETPTSVFTATPAAPFKVGATRDFIRGNQRVTEEYQKDGTWKPIATGEAHGQGVSVTYGAPVAGVDPQGNPVFFQPPKGGGAPAIIQGVKPPEQAGAKPSEFEAKAGLYFKSMKNASDTLNKLEETSNTYKPSLAESAFDESTKTGQFAMSKIRSPERKQYIQGQKQWIDSINRVRSGANLPEIEYNRAVATFFPQLNDPDSVIEQKKLARQQEETSMQTAAGKALPKIVNQIIPNNEPMPTRSRQDILNQYGVKPNGSN